MKLELANSGEACIEAVREKKFDCILLDQMMPGMNGEQTLTSMKEQGLLKGTPVVALTADAIIGAKENYLSKGFNDYLSKPVKYDKLEELLKRYIPENKQLIKEEKEENLKTLLIWGNDSDKLRDAKEKLSGMYKCTCILGSKGMEKYLEKHEPDAVLHVIE